MGRCSPVLHDVPVPESRQLAGVTGRCSPTARGGSNLWSGRLAGGAATATKLTRVAGEGRTVFPQTLTTPRHSPPSRRGARRAGWCLPRRRQATARPTARLLAKHLNRTRARLEQGQASSRQAHWLAYYLPTTCLLLAYYLPTTCLLLACYLPATCLLLAYYLPTTCQNPAEEVRVWHGKRRKSTNRKTDTQAHYI